MQGMVGQVEEVRRPESAVVQFKDDEVSVDRDLANRMAGFDLVVLSIRLGAGDEENARKQDWPTRKAPNTSHVAPPPALITATAQPAICRDRSTSDSSNRQ